MAQDLTRREQLHLLLQEKLGSSNVYFQPPPNIRMVYPAIIYQRDDTDTSYAGNNPYLRVKRYQVTVVDSDPDSAIPDRIALIAMCAFSRHFTSEQLNHDVFTLYF